MTDAVTRDTQNGGIGHAIRGAGIEHKRNAFALSRILRMFGLAAVSGL